jgi:hypothetical protein
VYTGSPYISSYYQNRLENRVRQDRRRVEGNKTEKGEGEMTATLFLERKKIVFLRGSQALPTRLSDTDRMTAKASG